MNEIKIAALFVRADSIYKTLPGVDCYDVERDALTWPGGCPVVAHPPCRTWGKLKSFARAPAHEHGLAIWTVEQIRRWGGVLEHPLGSDLWREVNLPEAGWLPDEWGGYTLKIDQVHWGHPAQKATKLYVVGCSPADLPAMPPAIGKATHCITSMSGRLLNPQKRRSLKTFLPEIGQGNRDKTPPDFAQWLVKLARRCNTQYTSASAGG